MSQKTIVFWAMNLIITIWAVPIHRINKFLPKFNAQQVTHFPLPSLPIQYLVSLGCLSVSLFKRMLLSTQVQTLTVLLGLGWINGAFALTIYMASSQRMVFDEKQGKLVPWKPTYQEFARNPESYPEFEATMNYETGQLEVTPKKEAEKNPDRQIMTHMVQQGFFLPAWNSFVIDGTLWGMC